MLNLIHVCYIIYMVLQLTFSAFSPATFEPNVYPGALGSCLPVVSSSCCAKALAKSKHSTTSSTGILSAGLKWGGPWDGPSKQRRKQTKGHQAGSAASSCACACVLVRIRVPCCLRACVCVLHTFPDSHQDCVHPGISTQDFFSVCGALGRTTE